jgi:TonB family protein
MKRDFYAELKYSSLLHLAGLLLILIPLWSAPLRKPYLPSMKVDLVGLPDLLKKDVKNANFNQKIEKIITETKKLSLKDAVFSSPTTQTLRKRNQRALDRMQSLEHLESLQEEKFAGNQLSTGSSTKGQVTEDEKSRYNDALIQRIRSHWILPPWIARENLAAQVQITLDARGQLVSLEFIQDSGNLSFDEAIRKTIRQSAPFPIPPEQLVDSLLHEGILLGFPL